MRHVSLSILINELFDIYCQHKIAKQIGDVMNKKYIIEDEKTHNIHHREFKKIPNDRGWR